MTTFAKSQSPDFGYLLFSKITDFASKVSGNIRSSNLGSLKNKLPIFKSKGLILAVVLVIIVVAGIMWARSGSNNDSTPTISDQAYVSEGDKAELNKKFSIAIRSSDGKETGQALVINVASLQRTERILYKGKPLVSREGKDFIVINIEIENSTNNRLTVRPVDFFRLVADNGKNYAPDIQTDPVKVEPLSSKNTRTIYIVEDGQKNLKFMIGEIKGENKEMVEVVI